MFKFIKNFSKNLKLEFPWRLKSKLHDYFHYTGNQIHTRTISECTNKNFGKSEIIERLSGKKLSELSQNEVMEWEKYVEKKISDINDIDRSFDNVIPSLFSQKYYRGMNRTPVEIQNLKVGDIYTDTGYSWFSPSKRYTREFSSFVGGGSNPKDCTIIETTIPFGEKISRDIRFSISDGVTGLNPFSSMNVVIPRNRKYKVLERNVINNKTYLKWEYLGI